MKSKILLMGKILKEEFVLYQRKSQDYGTKPVEETGVVGLLVRIADKVHRALHLSENGRIATVTDENLEDTLMDISNYANMCLVELLTLKAKEDLSERSMKYIPRCKQVMGGMELEILEVEDSEIYDTEEEALEKEKWSCR